jgi:hypothetical protein
MWQGNFTSEVKRIDFELMECPACGKRFALKKEPPSS